MQRERVFSASQIPYCCQYYINDRFFLSSATYLQHCEAIEKAQAEIQLWRSKYETEGMGRIDELEGNKTKLLMRLQEAEETIDSLHNKVASTEKTKHRMTTNAKTNLFT